VRLRLDRLLLPIGPHELREQPAFTAMPSLIPGRRQDAQLCFLRKGLEIGQGGSCGPSVDWAEGRSGLQKLQGSLAQCRNGFQVLASYLAAYGGT
jgi:hypothetical protein